jgi:hypothetical protein
VASATFFAELKRRHRTTRTVIEFVVPGFLAKASLEIGCE